MQEKDAEVRKRRVRRRRRRNGKFPLIAQSKSWRDVAVERSI